MFCFFKEKEKRCSCSLQTFVPVGTFTDRLLVTVDDDQIHDL